MTKEETRRKLFKLTGCDLQGKNGGGWPCGTCFGEALRKLNVPKRPNFWRSILVYRGDYKLSEVNQTQAVVDRNIAALQKLLEDK